MYSANFYAYSHINIYNEHTFIYIDFIKWPCDTKKTTANIKLKFYSILKEKRQNKKIAFAVKKLETREVVSK